VRNHHKDSDKKEENYTMQKDAINIRATITITGFKTNHSGKTTGYLIHKRGCHKHKNQSSIKRYEPFFGVR
jgi:hypothetical protein